jgi:LacI family transcriptional regulator
VSVGKVTLSDVAKVAGVSLSTASKALSGHDRVSEETRQRIRDVARRLDFHPDALAQSFAQGRSRTVGILTQNAVGTWSLPILAGATTELGRHEHATLLYDAAFDTATLDASIRRLQARRIDGLLVIGDGPHYVMRSVNHAFTVPVAYAFTRTDDPDDVTFVPDNVDVGRTATEHLLQTGRRRIAHLTADDVAADDRERGYLAALAAAGVEPAHPTMRGLWNEPSGVELATALVASGAEIDAIFCGNDHIARGAERVLRSHGVRIPQDVALVGVDNWEGLVVRHGEPHLTTIDTRLSHLGAAAAGYLLFGRAARGPQLEPCTLVLGETTA